MSTMNAELAALSKLVVEKFHSSFDYFEKKYQLQELETFALLMHSKRNKVVMWSIQTLFLLSWIEGWIPGWFVIIVFLIGLVLGIIDFIFSKLLDKAIRNAVEHAQYNTAFELNIETAKSFLEMDLKYLEWL